MNKSTRCILGLTYPNNLHEEKMSYTAEIKKSVFLCCCCFLFLHTLMCIFVHSVNLFKNGISSYIRCIIKFLNFERHGNCPSVEFIWRCDCCNCNINWASREARKIFRKLIILTSRKKKCRFIFSKVLR